MNTPPNARFLALHGLLQWTRAVITQSQRCSEAYAQLRAFMRAPDPTAIQQYDPRTMRDASLALHAECHLFCDAAFMLLRHRDWVIAQGMIVDFSPLDAFSSTDIKDVRDMREHVIEYFSGKGRNEKRWVKEEPDFKADASSLVDTKIGGRLDWIAFGKAAECLLPEVAKAAEAV